MLSSPYLILGIQLKVVAKKLFYRGKYLHQFQVLVMLPYIFPAVNKQTRVFDTMTLLEFQPYQLLFLHSSQPDLDYPL